MRVLIVNDIPPGLSGTGGVETHIRQLKEALTEHGLTVALMASQSAGEPERIEDDFFLIPHLNSPPLRKHALDNHRKQQAALQRAAEMIRRFRPDVINVHNFINPGVLGLLRNYAPVVKSLHDVRPFCVKPPPIPHSRLVGNTTEFCNRTFGPKCFWYCYVRSGGSVTDRLASWAQFPANFRCLDEILKCDRIVTYGTFLKNMAARLYPDPERIHIVYHFTDAEEMSVEFTLEPHREPVFIFAGRLSFEKGVRDIFNALDCIQNISCRVIIAGDGPLREDVERWAGAVSSNHHVELKGFLNQEQLYDLYRQTSVLLFPSIGAEGCPLVGLESMYFGNTAIGYDTGGAGEWLVDGQTGIRVERGDAEGLARAMVRLANNPEERFRLRTQAQKYVRNKFRRETHVRQLVEIYEQAINDHAGASNDNR